MSLSLLISLLCLITGGTPESLASVRIFDVRQFGAKGDGKNLDTSAIQEALDECGKTGGGIVRFPAGTFLSKPIFLRNQTTLELGAGAVLQATDERAAFESPEKTNAFMAFVNGKNLHDIAIIGRGTIDGAGARWWKPAEEARRKRPGYVLPRPSLIVLVDCTNVCVQNVTLRNSPLTHLAPTSCEAVVISNITVSAPARAANTDAIDPIGCRNVLITHCRMDVGDDNISIKSNQANPDRPFASENITVTDCIFLHGHGLSIGAATVGGVRNVTVRDCTFEDTENGFRIKSQRGRGGTVEHVRVSDIMMKNVDPAITLTCYYMNNSARDPVQRSLPQNDPPQPVRNTTPTFRDIRISNLKATCQRSAGVICGLPESPISDVILENVQIVAATTGLSIKNARRIQFENVKITNEEGPPFIVENAQIAGLKAVQK
ncbi:MAG TPA: glycoside hydrolase family 28 protein [Verrucomicrobiae bacterium]|nr:glycoside hydrolase family 28 protein [Verrucomicrobiae bacterium]